MGTLGTLDVTCRDRRLGVAQETVGGHIIRNWAALNPVMGGDGQESEFRRNFQGHCRCWILTWTEGKGKLTPGLRWVAWGEVAGGLSLAEVRHKDKEKLKNSQITKLQCPGWGH